MKNSFGTFEHAGIENLSQIIALETTLCWRRSKFLKKSKFSEEIVNMAVRKDTKFIESISWYRVEDSAQHLQKGQHAHDVSPGNEREESIISALHSVKNHNPAACFGAKTTLSQTPDKSTLETSPATRISL